MRLSPPRRLLIFLPAILLSLSGPELLGAPSTDSTIPTFFVPNAGQADTGVWFQTSSSSGTAFFRSSEIVFVAHAGGQPGSKPGSGVALDVTDHGDVPAPSPHALRVRRLQFDNSNPDVTVTGADPLPGIVNIFRGSVPSKWQTRLPIYAGIIYHGIYPGIDLRIGTGGSGIEASFLVAPGADPTKIRWRSTDQPERTSTGRSVMQEANGLFGLTIPAGYSGTQAIALDATSLFYSTFLGGSDFDLAYSIAVDALGAAYVTGYTLSTDFPTVGPYQPSSGGGYDAFVAKLDPSRFGAASLVYATYLGGSGNDFGVRIAVDASGAAYVTGIARAGFPTTSNAYQQTFGSAAGTGADAFLSKLSPDGSALPYSTYFGGSSGDGAWGLATDDSGGAWLTGQTYSSDFPLTEGAYQTTCGCDGATTSDAFVARLDTTLSGTASLVFSTLLGGSAFDQGFGITLGPSNAVIITGRTTSTDFPTVGPYQDSSGGDYDAFVAKLNAGGTSLLYSTYLGGAGYDDGYTIAVDGSGKALATGTTASSAFPTTAGAFQGTFGGVFDAYLVRLDTGVSGAGSLLYATFVGGSNDDEGYGLALDQFGNANLTGFTLSSDFPSTMCPYHAVSGGGYDAFVVKMNPAAAGASSLLSSGYFGGAGTDAGYGLALDDAGNVYLAGQTSSVDFPTIDPSSGNLNGTTDAFVAKLIAPGTLPAPAAANNGPVCAGSTLSLSTPTVSGATYAWTGPNSFSSAVQNPTIPNATAANAGSYGVVIMAAGCTSPPGQTTVVVNPVPATPSVAVPTVVAAGTTGWTASVPAHAGSTFAWLITNGTITAGQGTSQITFTAGTAGTPLMLSVTETGSSGCVSAPGTATLTVAPVAAATQFYIVTACRKLDTRSGSPLAAFTTLTVPLTGTPCGIPSGATSVSVNLTVTQQTAQGFLTIYPADRTQPLVSNINFKVEASRANNANLLLSSDGTGSVKVYNGSGGTVHVILDVNGYFQ